ncbi:hypothetical protein GGR52DRAFT_574118 [Hypoxylon sp. FL1284]|nr:hypothetical protein GGR52DRAFT_574118 [Hypoxylon sp. FL1284]
MSCTYSASILLQYPNGKHSGFAAIMVATGARRNLENRMATIPTYPPAEVEEALEAAAAYQVETIASIMGFMGLCWVLLGVFFVYHFCKPLKSIDSESMVELRIVNAEDEKKWWIDDSDAV